MKSNKSNLAIVENNKSELFSTNKSGSFAVNVQKPLSNEIELRIIKLETVVAILSNQNDLLTKKVEDLENLLAQERISHTSKNLNNNLNTTKLSISSKNTSAGSANEDGSYEVFNINSNNFASEETRKELDDKITKIDAKCENVFKKLNEFQKKIENYNTEINIINNNLEDINSLHLIFSQKIDKITKLEKLIKECILKVDAVKADNSMCKEELEIKSSDQAEKLNSFRLKANKEFEAINACLNEFNCTISELKNKHNTQELKLTEDFNQIKNKISSEFKQELLKQELNIKALKSKSHSQRSSNFKKDEIYRFDASHAGSRNNHHTNNENHSVRSFVNDREKANDINSFSFSDEAKRYPSLLNNYVRNVNFYE